MPTIISIFVSPFSFWPAELLQLFLVAQGLTRLAKVWLFRQNVKIWQMFINIITNEEIFEFHSLFNTIREKQTSINVVYTSQAGRK